MSDKQKSKSGKERKVLRDSSATASPVVPPTLSGTAPVVPPTQSGTASIPSGGIVLGRACLDATPTLSESKLTINAPTSASCNKKREGITEPNQTRDDRGQQDVFFRGRWNGSNGLRDAPPPPPLTRPWNVVAASNRGAIKDRPPRLPPGVKVLKFLKKPGPVDDQDEEISRPRLPPGVKTLKFFKRPAPVVYEKEDGDMDASKTGTTQGPPETGETPKEKSSASGSVEFQLGNLGLDDPAPDSGTSLPVLAESWADEMDEEDRRQREEDEKRKREK